MALVKTYRGFLGSAGVDAAYGIRSIGFAGLFALSLWSAAGCGNGSQPAAAAPNDARLRGVLVTYATATRNLKRPPENLEELKAVVASVADDPAEYFRSAGDNEDFLIVWSMRLNSAPPGTLLACERTGVNGVRKGVTTDGKVREISAEEFSKFDSSVH